ncbi:pimeloyl-ACP methyl ester carboxylesterase [Amycolatopsis bartoniae]|uniref:Transporter n=1 Tax=Amycolatopsis bartoniae TaxID=941986 RepID=A0A8H9MEX3_9PSEU|nr:alpha/beta fold hydrolase [Amycolatopsis bartoniae]MBB2938959.1 pimeloyl-ACP methyl ester carboxylesterase [Amycolatopsis bartoniae]TVT11238.1 alpha/beta hydrolase [Amycolatopsis bartoniae]GHF65922.1 transporter [Amycolatopsis bartoniae]
MRTKLFGPGLLVASLTLVAGSTPALAAVPGNPYLHQQLAWGPCLFKTTEGSKTSECAQVTVPRDWAHPDAGVDLRVTISRVRATGTADQRRGAILVNPGGPGGQGSPLAGEIAGLEPQVNQAYDFIGMDPRGTGEAGGTAPEQQGLVCQVPQDQLSPQDTLLDARDRSAASIRLHQQRPRAVARACEADPLTPYITTWQTTHDMDLIRALLGEEKLNYLGYSYGTWLGAKYASLFPDHTGKVVLDSSVNWQGRLQADFEDFPVIDQRQFDDVYLPWAARQFPEQLGPTAADAKRTWEQVRAYYATQHVSPDSYDQLFAGNGSEIQWMLSLLVFVAGAQAVHGDSPATPPAQLSDQLDAQSRASFGVPFTQLTAARVVAKGQSLAETTPAGGTRFAVACGDQPTRSAAWYKALSDVQGPRYPLYGWAYGLSEVCGFWTGDPQHVLPQLPHQVAANVLVVQGEFDPQTGYDQASAAVRSAPGVSLVSVDDAAFHGQYALTANPCVDGMVNVFLLDNSRPGNSTCPSVPLPGEDKVYPVAGPVGAGAHPAQVVPRVLSELRQTVQELLSRTNHW